MSSSLGPAIANFFSYFGGGVACLIAFTWIYLQFTPYNEFKLMKQGNVSATLSFCGALLGFSLPLVRAIEQSVTATDLLIWAALSLSVQVAAFLGCRKLSPHLSSR